MGLSGGLATNGGLPSSGGSGDSPTIQGAQGTNLGATQTINLASQSTSNIWLVGTLNTNLAITVTGPAAGARARLLLLQDATGGRTVTVNGSAVTISSAANSFSMVEINTPDGTNFDVAPFSGGGSLFFVTAAGNLGATYTFNPNGAARSLVTGTLTANCTITLSGLAAGEEVVFELTQDATGGRTLSITDGAQTVNATPDPTAGALTTVVVRTPDGSTLEVDSSGVGMTNPMTAANDLIVGGAAGAPARLATVASMYLGTDSSGNVGWRTVSASGGGTNIPKLVLPAYYNAPIVEAVVAPVANRMMAMRCIVPASGFLRDLSFWIGTTSGNFILSVYDTGDASAGNRTRLGTSGSTAVGLSNTWQTPWDPGASAIAVTAGQQLDLVLSFDNATVTVGRGQTAVHDNSTQLPTTNFDIVPGGASPKLKWQNDPGSFTHPTPIAEASCVLGGVYPMIIARVA